MKNTFRKKILTNALFATLILSPLSMIHAQTESKARVSKVTVQQQRTQVPGFYRMILGDIEVTALFDGAVNLETKMLKGASPQKIDNLFKNGFIDTSNGMQTAVNAYLINTGKNLILVDTGAAACFGPTLGNIGANIKAAGYTNEQIDTILLTHLHPDHACGLVNGDQPLFPNATVFVSKIEANHWLDKATTEGADAAAQGLFKMAQASVAPYITREQFKTYEIGDQIVSGIEPIAAFGHTPGHTAYLLKSKDQSLLIWGDLVHSPTLQFEHPEISIEFDSNQTQAIKTRKKIMADAAKNKLWIAGAHSPFPGIGHIKKGAKSGFTWVPVEYSPIK